ncbi:MAG: hypothetical protein HC904_00715 [Blastochloris sp.]|nr:hypothetical protein [Blastochloris sp.]
MNLRGRRIHIVGSADPTADEEKLGYVHSLVSELTNALVAEGANFVIPFGKEPFLTEREDGLSIIFDWTVAEAVSKAQIKGIAKPSGPNGYLIATLATSKTDFQIPAVRRVIYEQLRDTNSIGIEFLEPGWSAGAISRSRLAQLGDILIAISGVKGLSNLQSNIPQG